MAKFRRNGGGGSSKKTAPVHSIQFNTGGGTVEAAIWENTVGEGDEERVVYNVTLKRSYHDGKEWQTTNSLRYQEIPHAVECLMEAYRYLQSENQRK